MSHIIFTVENRLTLQEKRITILIISDSRDEHYVVYTYTTEHYTYTDRKTRMTSYFVGTEGEKKRQNKNN